MQIASRSEIEIVPAVPSDGQSDVAGRPLLSLVIPVRDAAGSLPATLNAITRWIARSGIGVEVVVIDDGSSDGTRATASSFARRIANLQVLRHVERRGRLEAIRTGEGVATGELIAFGSAHHLEESLRACPDLLGALLQGADVAVLTGPAEKPVTPLPGPAGRSLTDTWVSWIRRKIARTRHEPALVLLRAEALRRMMAVAQPEDDPDPDPDWVSLARRADCVISVLFPGSPSAPPRLRPARTA